MDLVIFFVIGLVLGAAAVLFLMRSQRQQLQRMIGERDQTLAEREQALVQQTEERQQLAVRAEVLASQLAEQERRHSEAIAAQQQRFDDTMARVTAQLKDATGEMLRQRQREFQEASSGTLGQIVTPLRETIDKMQKAMAETQNRQSEDAGAMKAIIQQMMQQSEATRRSTDELTRVFRRSNTVQGEWGEAVLDELLTSQGLTRGIHYDLQATIRDAAGAAVTTESGARMRPDVILHLDQRREVIIDSKVSLAAYMDYVNATNEADSQRFLQAHIASIREQVNRLATKDYSAYIQPPKVKMDYVIMFVPHTGALWTALNAQPDLWRRAMERGVYIADEQTLFAALRIIRLTWTQIAQAQNHERVYGLANEMMDRVGQFIRKFQGIGTALTKAQQAYDDAERKLQPSGQSILQTCAKLQKLGAKPSDKNSLPLFTTDEDQQNNDQEINTEQS